MSKPRNDRVRVDLDVEPGTLLAVEQWAVAYDDGQVLIQQDEVRANKAAEHSSDDDPGYVVKRLVTVAVTVWSKP